MTIITNYENKQLLNFEDNLSSDISTVSYLHEVVNAVLIPGTTTYETANDYISDYSNGLASYEETRSSIASLSYGIFANAASGANPTGTQVLAPDSMKDYPNLTPTDKLRFAQKILESNTANEKAAANAKIAAVEAENALLKTELAELKAMFHNFIIVDNAKTQALATAINSLHDNQQHITTAGETGELLNDNYNQL